MLGGGALAISPRHGHDLPPAPVRAPGYGRRKSRSWRGRGGRIRAHAWFRAFSGSARILETRAPLELLRADSPPIPETPSVVRRGRVSQEIRLGQPMVPEGRGLGDGRRQPPSDVPPPRPRPPTRPRSHGPGPWGRGRGAERWGNEGAAHHNLTTDYLRPPSPEKNTPRADGDGKRWKGEPGGSGARGGLGDARRLVIPTARSISRPCSRAPASGRGESRANVEWIGQMTFPRIHRPSVRGTRYTGHTHPSPPSYSPSTARREH